MFKKITQVTLLVVSALLVSAALTGCASAPSSGPVTNSAYQENTALRTVSGETIQPDNDRLSVFPDLGLGLLLPQEWLGQDDKMTFVATNDGYCIGFLPPSQTPDYTKMSEQEAAEFDFAALFAKQLKFIKIFFDDAAKSEATIAQENPEYQQIDKIASLDDLTYYVASNTTISATEHPELTPEDQQTLQTLAQPLEQLKKDLILFPRENSQEENLVTNAQWQALQGQDMQGNAVTADIFSDYDLTMVNIWTTWCGPCVAELPALAQLANELPPNVNLITICANGAEDKAGAEEILRETLAESNQNGGQGRAFTTICGDQNLNDSTLKQIVAYPITFFIDRNGCTVGDPLSGSWGKELYQQEIDARL